MRSFFRCCIGVVFAAALSASAQPLSSYLWTNVVAFPTLGSLTNPVCITSPPGETNRLFICEHGGIIDVITNLAAPNRTIFMDLTSRTVFSGEAGLLGLAFHPGFATNGYFYVSYNGTNSSLSDIVSRFKISATNSNQGDSNSELQLYVQPDRAPNHNGGDIHFGPDGYLYIAVGDEGDEHNTLHSAQHIDQNLFSGVLRIDVDKLPGNLAPNPDAGATITANYSIPADNPFVGATSFDGIAVNPAQVRTEFWAVGLRNPWRFSFDPATGILYCGDVGQDQVEEVNIIKKGGNYGWATYEGTTSPPSGVNTNGQPVAQNVTFPIIKYNHGSATNQGNCVIGGYVYRGTRFPALKGAYVYADYADGYFWATFYNGINATPPVVLFKGTSPTAFGIDPRNGDILYTMDGTSAIRRIISQKPNIGSIDFNTTNVVLDGVGGPPGSNYFLLTSSNLMSWVYSLTGKLDGLGNFTATNSVSTNDMQKFYRISR